MSKEQKCWSVDFDVVAGVPLHLSIIQVLSSSLNIPFLMLYFIHIKKPYYHHQTGQALSIKQYHRDTMQQQLLTHHKITNPRSFFPRFFLHP